MLFFFSRPKKDYYNHFRDFVIIYKIFSLYGAAVAAACSILSITIVEKNNAKNRFGRKKIAV